MEEICKKCGNEVKMQSQKNTGFCSAICATPEGGHPRVTHYTMLTRDEAAVLEDSRRPGHRLVSEVENERV